MRPVAGAIGVLVIGLLAGGTSASATFIDLSTWTCAKFQAANKDDIGVILAWMDGYYRGEDDPPVIDTEKFVANAKKLGEFCAAHPDTGIITAADELFAGEGAPSRDALTPSVSVAARWHRVEQAFDLVGGIGGAIDACERLRAFAGVLLE